MSKLTLTGCGDTGCTERAGDTEALSEACGMDAGAPRSLQLPRLRPLAAVGAPPCPTPNPGNVASARDGWKGEDGPFPPCSFSDRGLALGPALRPCAALPPTPAATSSASRPALSLSPAPLPPCAATPLPSQRLGRVTVSPDHHPPPSPGTPLNLGVQLSPSLCPPVGAHWSACTPASWWPPPLQTEDKDPRALFLGYKKEGLHSQPAL